MASLGMEFVPGAHNAGYRMSPDRTRWEIACGDFVDEKAALAHFDQLIETSRLFGMLREVDGWMLFNTLRKVGCR